MKVDDYMNSPMVTLKIKKLFEDKDVKSDRELLGGVKTFGVDSFNAGFVEGLGYRKRVQGISDLKKSKELTNLTPSKFKNTDVCNTLSEEVLGVVETNSTENVLDVGYEKFLKESLQKVLQVAYAMGLAAGFGIASDPVTASLYMANEEKIFKYGMGEEK